MAEKATIARPYARAAFDYARAQDDLAGWSTLLAAATAVVENPQIQALLTSPHVTAEQLAGLVIEAAGGQLDASGRNFITLLAENHRLGLLPDITALFDEYRGELENVADVSVTSAVALSDEQRTRLESALRKRFGRDVRMHCEVDPALLGGAVIRSGDLVIDGSLKARLERLGAQLAS
jgi:F-type H+-transporting ATPase subunit delta